MKNHKRKLFSPVWMCGVRSASAVIMSVLLVSSQTAAAVDERQPSAAEIVQPVAKSYQELQQALAGPPPITPLTPDQVVARLDKLFPILEQAEKQIPRDTFDPQPIIDKVGKDPRKIFEWVRDSTYFAPYRGLLRGDKGVLMDRLGNSLDRAMLLYALLGFVNQPARMVRGSLTEAQASDLLTKVRPFPSFEQRTGSGASSAGTEEFVKQYAQQNHLDPVRIRKALDDLAAQQQHMKELVQKRVAAQAKMIAGAVGAPPANAAAEERAAQVKAVTDHWWVQWQNAGKWTDFDPTLTDAQPGQTLTAMHSNVSPKAYTDVGEDLVHTVQIQVVVEVWKQGQVKEVPVLTQKLVPADLIGEPIVLRQIPVHWPQGLNLLQDKHPLETFKKTVLAQTEWLPVLAVGSRNISKYSFDDHGDLHDSTLPGYVQSVMAGQALTHAEEQGVGGLGQGVGGILGQHQIPNKPEKTTPQQGSAPNGPQVTAEWIDFDIQTPGKSSRTIRREIFDLIGPAIRESTRYVPTPQITGAQTLNRALALMGKVDVCPLAAQPSATFLQRTADENLVANRQAILDAIHNTALGESKKFTRELGQFRPGIALRVYSLAYQRFAWSRDNSHIYLDEPNIFTYHKQPQLGINGAITLAEGFDIVANHVAVAPGRTQKSFIARLEQGVLDTNVEAALAMSANDVQNTANAFAKASADGTTWLAIRDARSPASWESGLRKDVRARILQDLAHGYAVMVPPPNTKLTLCGAGCWWRINPRTGEALGIGDRGWGQTIAEYFKEFPHESIFAVAAFLLCKHAFCHSTLTCFWVALAEGAAGAGGAMSMGVEASIEVCILGFAMEAIVLSEDASKGENPCRAAPST